MLVWSKTLDTVYQKYVVVFFLPYSNPKRGHECTKYQEHHPAFNLMNVFIIQSATFTYLPLLDYIKAELQHI